MDGLVSDLRFAWRGLRNRPAFALTSLLVLAIGIGATTVMFSTLYTVLLRPLPFAEPERLVWLWGTTEGRNANTLSAMDYFDYRERCDAFGSLAAHLFTNPGRIVTGLGEPERVRSTVVSHNLFETLGVTPLSGRSFTLEDEARGGPNVVIASYGFLQRHFGGSNDAVGTLIEVDGDAYELIGVMPREYAYPEGVELWFPMRDDGPWERSRGNRNFNAIGRLKPSVTIEEAQSRVSAVAAELAESYPEDDESWGVRLEGLHERFVGGLRPAMNMLMGAVSLLLLIACSNLSSLFLANVTSRSRELGVRLSLGASRGAIARQLLVESLLIASLGAFVGVLLANVGVHLIRTLGPADVPGLQHITIDVTVLAGALGTTVLAGLLFGMAPVIQGARRGLASASKGGRASTVGGASLRMRNLLVGAQMALCLILLLGSGLLLRSLFRLRSVDPGFAPAGVLTMDVQLPAFRYVEEAEQARFFSEALDRIRALPGVVDASAASYFPLESNLWNSLWRADQPPPSPSERKGAIRRRTMENYFETLQVPLLTGRTFQASDRIGSRPVVVVSRALAASFFPQERALGRSLILPWGEGIELEIIGVVGDLRDRGLAEDPFPVFYLPFRQYPSDFLRIAIRVGDEPTRMTSSVRAIFREMDNDVPVFNVSTLQAQVSGSTSRERFQTVLLSGFAMMALALASVGLYGVLSYFVSQRTREFGIRMALGARGSRVMAEVLRRGLGIATLGIGIGLAGSLILSRFLRRLLFDVAPLDLTTYLGAPAVLAVVILAASMIPARRALRIDPVTALRNE